jgi:Flp pilus assembly protein TadD
MIRYEHIVATIQVSGGARYVLDFLPEFKLGDYDSAPIADDIALALYYNNLGAAIKRSGRFDLAEYIYSKALQHDPQNYSALSNLVGLYRFQGRAKEAEMISARVEGYRDRNPYYHFFRAKLLLTDGKYEQALLLLRRSVLLKQDESDFYLALSQTYAALGDVAVSERMADKARKYRKGMPSIEESEMGRRFWTDGVLIKY